MQQLLECTALTGLSSIPKWSYSNFISHAGTDEVEWCFSQVKGTVEEEVTEGRREFLFDYTRKIVTAKCKQRNGVWLKSKNGISNANKS